MGLLAVLTLAVVFVACALLRGPVDDATDQAIEDGNPAAVVGAGCGGVAAIGIIALLGSMIAIGLLAQQ